MQINYDPDEFEAVTTRRICPFHEENPGESFAGCTCSSSYAQRRRSPEQIAEIKAKKRREEEDRILAQAELIRAMIVRRICLTTSHPIAGNGTATPPKRSTDASKN